MCRNGGADGVKEASDVMSATTQHIVDLERLNYIAMHPIAQVTPGLEITLRDDVVITSSESFPGPDTTHACLLRATPHTAQNLIAEVITIFESRGLPTTIYLSPACTPADLSKQLLARGFAKQEAEEAWLVLSDLHNFSIPPLLPNTVTRRITRDEVLTVAEIFMSAFGMDIEFAPYMAHMLEPTLDLPSVHHYIALVDEQPVGTCSLLCHDNVGILGSAGVLPAHRKSGAATNLAVQAATEARAKGIDTLMLQTRADTRLERALRIGGFTREFTRICYTLA